jgi:hypothetical protein
MCASRQSGVFGAFTETVPARYKSEPLEVQGSGTEHILRNSVSAPRVQGPAAYTRSLKRCNEASRADGSRACSGVASHWVLSAWASR